MRLLRCITSSILVGLIISYTTIPALAVDVTGRDEVIQITTVEEEQPEVYQDDLNVQLNDLYHEIGEKLNIDYMYVKIMHMIAGGKAVYADASPNIKVDKTVDSLPGAFDIQGATQEYSLAADWIECPDEYLDRPSKYYLPDAAYSVMAEVIAIMNTRYYADRGAMQVYFDALNNDVKTTIIFCEAVLQYTGSSIGAVNSFYSIYEKILYDKDNNENVLESDLNGNFTFKDKYKDVIVNNGIKTDRELEILSIILRFDANLAASASTDEVSDEIVTPYIVGYQSRENMMIAAMSIVGKVRYVWGGGHLGAGSIRGINPDWKIFNDTYNTSDYDGSSLMCIKPGTSWCPIHGAVSNSNGCLFESDTVYSTEQFIEERADKYNTEQFSTESFNNLMDQASISNGIQSHRLDGLDCSGYASWVYNQVQTDVNYDSGAIRFISQRGITSLPEGTRLLPGDVFSWGDHIIVIVGPVANKSKAYVMVESGPSVVKFGVAYYGGASSSDISEAKQIAIEANTLIGDISQDENVRSFNMSALKFSASEDDTYNAQYDGYHGWGRLSKTFIDENMILSDYGKTIKEMTATEIIQHTIDRLPYQYISGVNSYSGTLFKYSGITGACDIEAGEVKKENIVLTDELSIQGDKQSGETIKEGIEQE